MNIPSADAEPELPPPVFPVMNMCDFRSHSSLCIWSNKLLSLDRNTDHSTCTSVGPDHFLVSTSTDLPTSDTNAAGSFKEIVGKLRC